MRQGYGLDLQGIQYTRHHVPVGVLLACRGPPHWRNRAALARIPNIENNDYIMQPLPSFTGCLAPWETDTCPSLEYLVNLVV
eukprot:2740411-Pyramimonas_sp.AAC.1